MSGLNMIVSSAVGTGGLNETTNRPSHQTCQFRMNATLATVAVMDLAGTTLAKAREQIQRTVRNLFAQQFLVIATDMAAALLRGWTHPSPVARELAIRCLLDQVVVIQDLYGLEPADRWRGRLEERMLEDTDSEMQNQNAGRIRRRR